MNRRQELAAGLCLVLVIIGGFFVFRLGRQGGSSVFSSQNPNELSEADKASIASAFVDFLRNRQAPAGRCANYLTIGVASVTDYSINGATGTVQLDTPVTATAGAIPEANGMNSGVTLCYGSPPSAILPGEAFTSTWQTTIERWQSGWRVNVSQDMRPSNVVVTAQGTPPPPPAPAAQSPQAMQQVVADMSAAAAAAAQASARPQADTDPHLFTVIPGQVPGWLHTPPGYAVSYRSDDGKPMAMQCSPNQDRPPLDASGLPCSPQTPTVWFRFLAMDTDRGPRVIHYQFVQPH